MRAKEKRDGKGVCKKMKGRLVGDGRTQNREVYQKLESPTAPIEDVFMELELASRYKRRTTNVDVSAAYLNAEIEDSENVVMWLTR